MKRIISLMLVFLFLMGCVSCKKKEEPSTPTLEVTYESTDQGSVLPDKNWENRDLKVFINQNELVGNIIENSNLADAVGYEVYSRNMYLSEKYNFNILCTEMSTAECPAQKVVNEAAMGESSYDLILDSVTDMKGALAQFVFADLAGMNYIDWNANGWLREANDSLDIYGYRYVCTGDANLYEKSGAVLMYYNRPLLAQITTEDIRQLALEGNWTMEKMAELIKLGAVSNSETGEVSVYGITHPTNEAFYNYLLTGYGMEIITKDQEGNLSYAFDDGGTMERTLAAIDEVLSFYCDEETTYTQRYKQTTPKAETFFLQNRSLFQPNMLCMMKTWREAGIDYGFLPLPKANTSVEKYGSAYYTEDTQFFAIPFYAEDHDFSAFALQALMENSGNLIHVYVENQCKIRGSYDQEDYDLITLALSNFIYDLGNVFNWGAIKTWIFVDRYDNNQELQSIPVAGVNNLVRNWESKKDLAYKEMNDFLMHFA